MPRLASRLVETITEVEGTARRLVDERLREIGEELGRLEQRLSEVEREIANLDAVEVDTVWVAQCLTDFDAVWGVLTPENRSRLMHAVVQHVEVDEPANKLSVTMVERGAGLPSHPIPEEAIA